MSTPGMWAPQQPHDGQAPPSPMPAAPPPYVPRYADAVTAGTWATQQKRRTWPWWVAAVALVALVAASLYVVRSGALDELLDPAGPYTGAPVTASDVPSPGYVMVASPDEAVAFEAASGWVDVTQWLSIDDPGVNFPAWATHVGEYFMGQPGEAGMVLVLETDVATLAHGDSLRAVHDWHNEWTTGGGDEVEGISYDEQGTSRIHLENGLTGYETFYTVDFYGSEVDYVSLTFMQGDRIVFININGVGHDMHLRPYQHVLDTLRIDAE